MGCGLFSAFGAAAYIATGVLVGPTVLLAFLLPLALAISPNLRRKPVFPAWCFAVAPAVVALGALSSGTNAASAPALFGLAALGALLFVGYGREPKVAVPLAVLGVAACLVAYFSSGRGGPGPMESLFERWGLSRHAGEVLTISIRKTIHFTFYGTVGLSSLLALRGAGAGRNEALRGALLAALAVASCDELRQSGYANRTGSAWDVLLDLAGAAAFVGLSEWRRSKAR